MHVICYFLEGQRLFPSLKLTLGIHRKLLEVKLILNLRVEKRKQLKLSIV